MDQDNAASNEALSACAREKIHLLNRTQDYGVFLMAKANENPQNMKILQCSDNCARFNLGEPNELVGKTLGQVFELPECFLRNPTSGAIFEIMTLGGQEESQPQHQFTCSVKELEESWIIIELTPSQLESNLCGLLNTIFSSSKSIMTPDIQPEVLLDQVCNLLFDHCNFDSVMFYKFDARFNGEVTTEKSRRRQRFLGLRFPSTDIPVQARRLYMKNTVRFIHDTHSTPCRLVPDKTIDLSNCTLRSVSQTHIQYMKNMGVRSSASITVSINGVFHGMFVLHNYSRPQMLSFRTLESMRFIGDLISTKLSTLLSISISQKILQTEQLLAYPNGTPVVQVWKKASQQLVQLLGADCAFLLKRNISPESGKCYDAALHAGEEYFPPEALYEVMERLHLAIPLEMILSSNDHKSPSAAKLNKLFKADKEEYLYQNRHMLDIFEKALMETDQIPVDGFVPAGMLFISCSVYDIVFLRKEVVAEVSWGGRDCVGQKEDLKPRESFEKYIEREYGRCLPWEPDTPGIAKSIRIRILQYLSGEIQTVQRDLALQLSKRKGEFLAQMSHELRTPFNGIIGMLDVLLQAEMSAGDKDCVQTAYDSAIHMLKILDDVLLVSKMNASKLELNIVPVDLEKLLLVVLKLLKFRAQQTENEICASITQIPSCQVLCDPGRIRQILLNLLSNSLKFTHRGTVKVSLSFHKESETLIESISDLFSQHTSLSVDLGELEDHIRRDVQGYPIDSWCLIRVQDTGPGIDPESIKKLFEAFHQGKKDGARQYQGTGLGLYISQNLVQLMNGRIFVLSNEGEGSSFVFFVRIGTETDDYTLWSKELTVSDTAAAVCSDDEYSTNTIDSLASARNSVCNSPINFPQEKVFSSTVLVADDNEMNRKILNRLLSSEGVNELEILSDGAEALSYYKEHHEKIDTILLDLRMPVLDGWETARKIRKFEKENGIKPSKILCTTADILTDREQLLAAGFNDIVAKPITRQKIREFVLE